MLVVLALPDPSGPAAEHLQEIGLEDIVPGETVASDAQPDFGLGYCGHGETLFAGDLVRTVQYLVVHYLGISGLVVADLCVPLSQGTEPLDADHVLHNRAYTSFGGYRLQVASLRLYLDPYFHFPYSQPVVGWLDHPYYCSAADVGAAETIVVVDSVMWVVVVTLGDLNEMPVR